MKKIVFLSMAAAVALTSCSKDETVSVAGEKGISFRAVAGLNTRAQETTTANLASMFVTAYENDANAPYFSNVEYTRENTTNTFVSNPEYFWLKGKTINFLALSPAANDWSTTNNIAFNANTIEATFTDVTPDADVRNQKDLVIGAVSGSENTDADGLDLTLNHALSQIRVIVKNTNPAYIYNFKGMRIGSVAGKGTYTFPAGTWVAGTEKQTYDYVFKNKVGDYVDGIILTEREIADNPDDPYDPVVGDGAMLIPQQLTPWAGTPETSGDSFDGGAYISLLLNVYAKSGERFYPIYPANSRPTLSGYNTTDMGWAAIPFPAGTKWEAGKKYTYILDLSKGCGMVDPVEPNEDGKDIVKPGTDDPDKGEKIFGEPVKFDVIVTEWTNEENNIELQ